jgi:hypothetical protein
MRPSTRFFCFLAGCALLIGLIALQVWLPSARDEKRMEEMARLTENLTLTDLCLFTEARYTRHPSQADLRAPFQDHPAALEHFPSGSLVRPQRRPETSHGQMD